MRRLLQKLLKLAVLLREPAYRAGLRHGVAAAIEHEDLLKRLPIATVLDVGANKGQFSLLVRRWRPDAVIHAFEPLDEAAATYAAVFKADRKAILHRHAAGADTTLADIHISGRADSSSLLPIGKEQSTAFAGTAAVGTRPISVRKADDLVAAAALESPILIKLDVQGYELTALKGMTALLAKADYVYAEVSFLEFYEGQPLAADVIQWLAERSYRLASINEVSRTDAGRPAQADILFVRQGSSVAAVF